MSNQSTLHGLIRATSGQANILAIPRLYLNLVGNDHAAAFFLSQCVYWSDRSAANGGWFWKSYDEWQEEIGLSQYQVKRASTVCAEWVEVKLKKASGAPTLHYKVNIDALANSIIKFLDNRETSLSRNSTIDYQETSQSLTEITTETTKNIACEKSASSEQAQLLQAVTEAAIEESEQPKPKPAKKVRELMTPEERAVCEVWREEGIEPPYPAPAASGKVYAAFNTKWLGPVKRIIQHANGRSVDVAREVIKERKAAKWAWAAPISVLDRALELAAALPKQSPAAPQRKPGETRRAIWS